MSLHFAYGPEMLRGGPGIPDEEEPPVLFIARADGYQLRFLGQADGGAATADIAPQEGGTVWGAVFDTPDNGADEHIETRDASVPPQYQRITLKVTAQTKDKQPVHTKDGKEIADGAQVETTCYRAPDHEGEPASPSEQYLRRMIEGAAKLDLPLTYLQGLLNNTATEHRKGDGSVGVEDIQLGKKDPTQMEIRQIYSKAPPRYAVYRTDERVAVQFADDAKLAATQRKNMASLNSLRSQINGLISDWSRSSRRRYRDKAEKYERRVAAALILCLEDDGETALAALNEVKSDVTAERTSRGRFEYLIAASLVSGAAVALFLLIHALLISSASFLDPERAGHLGHLMLAAEAGTLGAFFSIALAIRNRTVLTNLHRWDNISDAVLRIVIGVIAATILVSMLGADILSDFKIGAAQISGHKVQWETLLVVGFTAGFLERLVPDLLQKAETKVPGGTATPASPADAVSKPMLAATADVAGPKNST
jgi:uncharacterized protein YukE